MDQLHLPDETERAILRIERSDLRKEQSTGWGATTGGQALTRLHHERLTEGVRVALLYAHSGMQSEAELVVLLRGLSPEVLALSCIQTVLHSIGQRETLRDTLIALGSSIANECWAAELTTANSGFATRVARAARLRHSSTRRRYSSAKAHVKHAAAKTGRKHTEAERKIAQSLVGFKERLWSKNSLMVAGTWLYNILMTTLPEVFKAIRATGTSEYSITITPEGWDVVDEALLRASDENPVFWPMSQEPKPLDAFTGGVSYDNRVNRFVTVVRTNHRDTQAAVKHAIKTGTMQPALDALNRLQAVPFKINTQVLEVMRECEGLGLKVKGLVPDDLEIPEKPNAFAWKAMTEPQQRLWSIQRDEKIKTNAGYVGDRVLYGMDMKTAEAMAQHERFYTPMNLDWRGRVYALCSFNFQREDRVRSLFLFAEGMPIGAEGLRYLKMHTANCADFKSPLHRHGRPCQDQQANPRGARTMVRRQYPTDYESSFGSARPHRVDESGKALPVPRSMFRVSSGIGAGAVVCDPSADQLRWFLFGAAAPVRHDASSRGLDGQLDLFGAAPGHLPDGGR